MNYLQRRIDLDDLAPLFDEVTLWGARFLIHLLDRIELRGGIRALDLGCASGVPLIELANVHGPSSRFTGIDMWSGALQQARKKIALQGLPNADLVEADGHKLPFRDGVFDLIVSSLGINNFDDPDAVFRECARVASPGARLVLTTNVRGHMRELYDVFRALLSGRARDRRQLREQLEDGHRAIVGERGRREARQCPPKGLFHFRRSGRTVDS